jgi:phosphotriesterase-related protein
MPIRHIRSSDECRAAPRAAPASIGTYVVRVTGVPDQRRAMLGGVATVDTVGGPVDVGDLGPTLMHEHVFVPNPLYVGNRGPTRWWSEDAQVAVAVAKLDAVAATGVCTIVDPTLWGRGDGITLMRRVAAGTTLTVVVATGHHPYVGGPDRRGDGPLDPAPLVALFTGDIRSGIGGTGVRAGLLTCSVPAAGLVPTVERTVRAVARTHLATGVPITVHTSAGARNGRLALDLFLTEGVDLTRVLIGHAADSDDLDYLMELADTGAILGMDRFGLSCYDPRIDRVATVVALAGRGYTDRMALSYDASCFIEKWDDPDDCATVDVTEPDFHYRYVGDRVLPALLEAGVCRADIDQMMVGTPRRYFGGVG